MSKKPRFDAMLDINDPEFPEKFRAAIGAQPGDTLEISTPQFTRTDGIVPALPDIPWCDLSRLPIDTLKTIGCRQWDEPNERGMVLMLFPGEWYAHLPVGMDIVDINGNREKFIPGVTDDDIRHGCLAYGVEVPA